MSRAGDTLDVMLDIDGVLYPFPELFTPYAAVQLGTELSLDTSSWAFYERWGLDHPGFIEMLTRGVHDRDLWWDDATYDEVPAVLAELRAGGHRLHLVTARGVAGHDDALAATQHWLDLVGVEVESINLVEDKPSVITRLGLDPHRCIAVDDAEHHVESWLAAGVSAVVLDRWGTYSGACRSVRDLVGFREVVDGLALASADGNTSRAG
jgi:beta-phosphoglucomutase-like phosphatase (HAD superfamily)